ncbi:uncharacterized protein [Eurosta solidaginis]|uniref:uncharacterized protein n=1 Tax=Eurosta solidaginis TaxID=178769 RepID=UPI003530C0CB
MEAVEKCVNNSNSSNNNSSNCKGLEAIRISHMKRLTKPREQIEIDVGVNESETELYEQMEIEIESENVKNVAESEDVISESATMATYQLGDLEINQIEEEQFITELVDASSIVAATEVKQSNGMRVAFGIILRFMLPIANSVMRRFKGLRDARFLHALQSITSSRHALVNLMTFAANTISMNLSSVQVSQRLGPILKLLKLRKSPDGIESLPDSPYINSVPFFPTAIPTVPPTTPTTSIHITGLSPLLRESSSGLPPYTITNRKAITPPPPTVPKCCTLKIIAEPPPGQPIRADIVFIHGLHGSLTKTWKQGLWENERQPVSFERPPKPPVRPPKRPKHSRSVLLQPPHKEKRARFAHNEKNERHSLEDDVVEHEREKDLDDGFFDATEQELQNGSSYFCGPPKDVHNYNGNEYSFPTFRLRLNDNGRLIQGDFETSSQNSTNSEADSRETEESLSHSAFTDSQLKGKTKLSTGDPNYSTCWPSDWLPLDCPGVRVIAINYTTDQYLWRPLWKKREPRSSLIERAREMTELLIQHRVGYGQPIVWVGHSKGGLFIKQIIVDAWECGRPAVAPLWRSSRGVFFYSVPHRGSHLACIKAPLLARSIEMLDIEKNNKYLLDLHRRFAGLYYLGHIKIEVFSFVETALTLMSVLYLRIVGVDSADPGFGDVCGIRLDHREICKPRSRDCILYKELVKMIKKVC